MKAVCFLLAKLPKLMVLNLTKLGRQEVCCILSNIVKVFDD